MSQLRSLSGQHSIESQVMTSWRAANARRAKRDARHVYVRVLPPMHVPRVLAIVVLFVMFLGLLMRRRERRKKSAVKRIYILSSSVLPFKKYHRSIYSFPYRGSMLSRFIVYFDRNDDL